ncbi:MAG: hypothetical protein ACYC99_01705 [Candidatus Geothermincolia bacterium]
MTLRPGSILFAVALVTVFATVGLTGCGSPRESSSWADITTGHLDSNGNTGAGISCLAYDPTHDILFAGAGSGVYRCASSSTTPVWTSMAAGEKLEHVESVLFDPARNVLYAAASSGVYRWANAEGPGSWTTTNGVGNNVSLAYDPAQDILYSGTGAGLYRCADPAGSPSWAQVSGGPVGAGTGSLLYDSNRKVLFTATDSQGIGVWRYESGTWTNLDPNFNGSTHIGGGTQLAYDSARDILYQSALDHARVDDTPLTGIRRCYKATTAPSWSMVKDQDSNYFSPIALNESADVLYAGAFVATLPPLLERSPNETEPNFNQRSHGLFAVSNPSTDPAWTKTGGPAKSSDVTRILYDPSHRDLYVITAGAVWRYRPPGTGGN